MPESPAYEPSLSGPRTGALGRTDLTYLMTHATQGLANLAGGVGTDEHAARMSRRRRRGRLARRMRPYWFGDRTGRVTLTYCVDSAAADWIVRSTLPWRRLVRFGPAGFDAYARLRFLPDPVRPGQRESDVVAEDWRTGQLPRLFELLAAGTTTADDCYFCVWEGFGQAERATDDDAGYLVVGDKQDQIERADARPGLAPTPVALPSVLPAPKVVVPHRAYWLFRGPLAEIGAWDSAEAWPGHQRLDGSQPAFVWPADHAWCVAWDVDPHWAGIGGGTRLISQLIADPLLDVVPADPSAEQPFYR